MKNKNSKNQLKAFLNNIANRGATGGIIFGILPAVVLFYACFTFVIQPEFDNIETLEKKVLALEEEVLKGQTVEANHSEFRAEFKKTVELFNETLPLLPKETEISNILFGLQALAQRSNVTLVGLEAQKSAIKTPNADKLYEREMPGKVTGSYNDVMRFFNEVSRQDRILIIRNFKVETLEKGKNQVQVDFALLAYHAPLSSEYPSNIPLELTTKNPVQIAAQN